MVDDSQSRIDAERVHIDPIATDAFGNVIGIMSVRVLHRRTVDDLPLFQDRRQRLVIQTTGIAQDQARPQGNRVKSMWLPKYTSLRKWIRYLSPSMPCNQWPPISLPVALTR